jgi:nucleotide-binding universal stress UspA family protein
MQTILAFVDFTDAMPEILQMAGRIALAFEAGIQVIHVVDPESDFDGEELRKDISRIGLAREMKKKRRALQIAAMSLKKTGARARAMLVFGSPTKKALDELLRRKPGLIIVGKHVHGRLHQFLSGGVGATLARKAKCPLLIVPVGGKLPVEGPRHAASAPDDAARTRN